MLTIVIPVFNEEKAIYNNFNRIKETLNQDCIDCQYVIVDDGSEDNSWLEIKKIVTNNKKVHAIRLSRNFGKEIAIIAGLNSLDSSLYLVMDSDLQHPPLEIKKMLLKMEETGADIVEGIKSFRGKESLFYKLFAVSFYKLLNILTGFNLANSSDFKLMNRKVVDELRNFQESKFFFRGVIDWAGFQKASHYFNVDERINGESNFSTMKLVRLSLNAITSYTSKPLYLIFFTGLGFLLISLFLGIQTLYNYFSGLSVSGFTTVIILILFSGSIIMLSLGIIGGYLAKIYDEVKYRPQYIISERLLDNE